LKRRSATTITKDAVPKRDRMPLIMLSIT